MSAPQPRSINDYKVALVKLGVKLPSGQHTKAEYQSLLEEAQAGRLGGKRKQPATPAEPTTERNTKRSRKAPTTASRPAPAIAHTPPPESPAAARTKAASVRHKTRRRAPRNAT